MKRIKAAAMMACTVTALALTACSGQETAEDPAPSVQDDSSADQVQGDAAGTDSAAMQRAEMLQRGLPETVS